MANQDITGNNVVSSAFLNVLLKLKSSVKKETNCAKIGIVTSIASNGNVFCRTLNNSSITVVCTTLKDMQIAVNDCVVILFIDDDIKSNILRLKNNQATQDYESTNLHSLDNGIIIGILNI